VRGEKGKVEERRIIGTTREGREGKEMKKEKWGGGGGGVG